MWPSFPPSTPCSRSPPVLQSGSGSASPERLAHHLLCHHSVASGRQWRYLPQGIPPSIQSCQQQERLGVHTILAWSKNNRGSSLLSQGLGEKVLFCWGRGMGIVPMGEAFPRPNPGENGVVERDLHSSQCYSRADSRGGN